MFRIKICGITRAEDALAATSAGADAIGLNFFPGSKRCVDRETAAEMVARVPRETRRVGVYVNAAIDEIREDIRRIGLNFVQLHGEEPPELLCELAVCPVIKAFRIGEQGLRPVDRYLDRCERLGCAPAMILLDSDLPGQRGGTGTTFDWSLLSPVHAENSRRQRPAIVLAGGLRPENVEVAIRTVRPFAVDTASGVESSPGIKDMAKLASFIAAEQRGFAAISRRD